MKYIKYSLACIVLLLIAIMWLLPSPPSRPEILIIRETTESQYGRPVVIVDYMVGGIFTSAVFYYYQMDEYQRVMQYLKSIGRVRYASPFLEDMGGE